MRGVQEVGMGTVNNDTTSVNPDGLVPKREGGSWVVINNNWFPFISGTAGEQG